MTKIDDEIAVVVLFVQILISVADVFMGQLCVPPVVAQTVGIQTRQHQLTEQLQVDPTGGTNI